MIDPAQLREIVIRKTLRYLDPQIKYSKAAENLLMGTCAQESAMGKYIAQINGPALGIFQMEPETFTDIINNFVRYRLDLHKKLDHISKHAHDMTFNLAHAAAMCRVHYYRQPEALPEEGDIEGMARYWKKYYNTKLGKGTESEFIENYHRYVK